MASPAALQIVKLALPEVLLVIPPLWTDPRGAFAETYHAEKYAALGIGDRFVQDNQSTSHRGVLRGLHFQSTKPQAKLCRVIQGEVFDVAVDVRRGSPTFAKWVGARLSAENRRQIYIPVGFAHGFVVLSERAEFLYKCSDFYDPADECGIVWNDPALRIEWGVSDPIVSDRDRGLQTLAAVAEERLPRFSAHDVIQPDR